MLYKRHSVAKEGWISLTLGLFFNRLAKNVLSWLDFMIRGIKFHKLEICGLCLLIMTAGCATQVGGLKGSDVEAKVGARAQARWDGLINGNLGDAYSYLSPGLRATMTQAAYQKKIRLGTWKKAKVSSVSCEEDRCKVAVQIELNSVGSLQIEEPLHEVWIREDGEWWYFWKK